MFARLASQFAVSEVRSACSRSVSRRAFLARSAAGLCGLGLAACGCRSKQTATVVKPGDKELVGSHQAGAETYGPLVDGAVSRLLSRHGQGIVPAGFVEGQPQPNQRPLMKICFVGVENRSIEEMGDFKEQLFEIIDAKIMHSGVYQTVSRRYVEAGLRQSRLRPDELMIPQNMRYFTQIMEQSGQPFDYMLWATVTSGTTQDNKDYQRNYLLTLEMINIHNGEADKEAAELVKQYNVSAMAKLKHLGQ